MSEKMAKNLQNSSDNFNGNLQTGGNFKKYFKN